MHGRQTLAESSSACCFVFRAHVRRSSQVAEALAPNLVAVHSVDYVGKPFLQRTKNINFIFAHCPICVEHLSAVPQELVAVFLCSGGSRVGHSNTSNTSARRMRELVESRTGPDTHHMQVAVVMFASVFQPTPKYFYIGPCGKFEADSTGFARSSCTPAAAATALQKAPLNLLQAPAPSSDQMAALKKSRRQKRSMSNAVFRSLLDAFTTTRGSVFGSLFCSWCCLF